MLDKDLSVSSDASSPYDVSFLTSPENAVKERAPLVLAMLAANSLEVQKAAADAGAIKKLSQLLKESYDDIAPNSPASLWAPDASHSPQMEAREEGSRLGHQGISTTAYHVMRLRESVLVALAAIASDKDEYRKTIIDQGVIPFVIRTLKPGDANSLSMPQTIMQMDSASGNRKVPAGNHRDAILAACGAARALSRSVSTLRTSLMDAGLAAPLFILMRCQDMELQIAATAVVVNLVLSFSPMREVCNLPLRMPLEIVLSLLQAIVEAGALRILCEHAHSMNTNLRLNSVWALKHLIYEASKEIKMKCLEELGPGWLKQIINNDVDCYASTPTSRFGDREDDSATPIRMSTPNAAGEQVDLLNAVEEDSRESSQDLEEDGEEDLKMSDSIGALGRAEPDRKQHNMSSHHSNGRGPLIETTAMLGRNTERRSSHQGLTDDLAIQKQGLDLVRNLICGTGASEMIDFVFRELGQDKLFEMLAAKLRPRILNAFHRDRRHPENGIRHVQPHIDIVISTCYILVHIAAGHPRQRQLLISQTELLKLIVPLFSNPNREIRTCCVWLVTNLTWVDDNSDNMNCKTRARELMKLGIFEKLEAMDHDEVLDIRERAKIALHQISTLLRSQG
jgi:hypothetical protein